MKPKKEELGNWLNDITDCGPIRNFMQEDLDALEEGLMIFIGSDNTKRLIEGTSSVDEVKALGIKRIKNYDCDNSHFSVKSINPKLRSFTFEIWHECSNTQIIIYKGDSTVDHIRLMWNELYTALFEFFTSKQKQLNLFDFAA